MNDKEIIECSTAIDSFLNGSCGEYDWDDFISIQSSNSAVQLIKNYCAESDIRYPPDTVGHWCNDRGAQKLVELSRLIKTGNKNDIRSFIEIEMKDAKQSTAPLPRDPVGHSDGECRTFCKK